MTMTKKIFDREIMAELSKNRQFFKSRVGYQRFTTIPIIGPIIGSRYFLFTVYILYYVGNRSFTTPQF